jgi:8-oxo-dGTP diphosphatase
MLRRSGYGASAIAGQPPWIATEGLWASCPGGFFIGLYNPSVHFLFPVTVHLLFFRGSEILIARRQNTGYRDGEYSVPAGHLDGGETVLAAGIREVWEEVGLRLTEADLEFAGVMHRIEGDERVDFFLRVRTWCGEPINNEPHKCDDLRWVDLDSLPENMVPYVRRAIGNSLRHVVFDEFGWDSTA